jgi:hypothetical protein
MERPASVARAWSAASVEGQRKELAAFDERWRNLADKTVSVSQQVDHRLIGSALARVHWELDILRRWRRDPGFYIEQTLTPVGEALTLPAPYGEKQSREIISRLNNIPEILQQAQQNLVSPPAPFAKMRLIRLPVFDRNWNRWRRRLRRKPRLVQESGGRLQNEPQQRWRHTEHGRRKPCQPCPRSRR